jgi:hypothetical protein
VKSVRFGSTVTDRPVLDLSTGATGGDLSILLSSATASISGTIADVEKTRVVIARLGDEWSNRYAVTKPDGSWLIDGLGPGSYRIGAVPEDDSFNIMRPGGLDGYEDVMESIEIHPGDKLSKDLKAIRR